MLKSGDFQRCFYLRWLTTVFFSTMGDYAQKLFSVEESTIFNILMFFFIGVISLQTIPRKQRLGKLLYHLLWMTYELQFKKETLLQFRNFLTMVGKETFPFFPTSLSVFYTTSHWVTTYLDYLVVVQSIVSRLQSMFFWIWNLQMFVHFES